MKRLVIALQFHDGDRLRAQALARMIADIETQYRNDVVIWFCHRFDCLPPDRETLKYVMQKMPARPFLCPTRGLGWPDGCNAMACDVFTETLRLFDLGGLDDDDVLLLMEPDCIPVSPTWISQLLKEWEIARDLGKFIVGAWRQSGPPEGHINGNGLFPVDLYRRVPYLVVVQHAISGSAWDCAFAPYFRADWYWTGLIANRWHEVALVDQTIRTPQTGTRAPVLVHGVKDNSVWNYAQRMFSLDRE